MSKLLVLGSSPAAIKAIEMIRAHNNEIDITVITYEGSFPYKRDVFANVLQKKASVEDIHCRDKKFYEENNIKIITSKTITRINLKTKKIYTEDKKQFDFDQIILAEMPEATKLTTIKGGNKEGIYALRKIKYVDRLIKELPFYETVVIQSNTFAGFYAAEALVKAGKEVYLIVPKHSPFMIIDDEAERAAFLEKLAAKNLHIVENASIEEILGDTEVKAVKLDSGKVLGTDVLVLGELLDDLKLVSEFGLNIEDDQIVVDENYQTNLAGVFAVDALVARHAHKWWSDFSITKSLEDQGARIASTYDIEYSAQSFIADKHFTLDGDTIILVHGSHVAETDFSANYRTADKNGFVGLLSFGGIMNAALLINAENQCEAIKELMVNGANIDSVVNALGLVSQQAEQESNESIDEAQKIEAEVSQGVNESND